MATPGPISTLLACIARLYLPSIVAMALWVFLWPLAVSSDPVQPLPWRAILLTLTVYLLSLAARLMARARHHRT